MKRSKNYFRGCLIGGAIGDAFGAPVKMIKYNKIIELHGEDGLQHLLVEDAAKQATITDDTQLTLFTAEGLVRSEVRAQQKGIERTQRDTSITVFRAYLRWLYTQGLRMPNWDDKSYDGWLVKLKKLHGYREPGITCITALGKGIMGTFKKPINQSRRCGTVIRIAPVGLFENEEDVFEVGKMIGAITHGTAPAYLASGTLATIIFYVIEGYELEDAINKAVERLKEEENNEECINAIEKAMTLLKEGSPCPDHLHQLGDGFMASEALAMAIYCVLAYPNDIHKGLKLAINQDGNSNSVAAIYGSIMGAYLGEEQIPEEFVQGIELREEIGQMAEDLLMRYDESEGFKGRYPGW